MKGEMSVLNIPYNKSPWKRPKSTSLPLGDPTLPTRIPSESGSRMKVS